MMGFSFSPPSSSLRAASELSPLKRSAKCFTLKKPFHKSSHLTPRRSHDDPTSATISSAPSTSVRAQIPECPYGGDVICISREDTTDSSSADEISPEEFQTPSTSPYPSSCSSSSSYGLPHELEDQVLGTANGVADECDPRRRSRLSMVSSWVDHHLQELNLSYNEDATYEIEIVTIGDDIPSRRDSFTLPPHETLQSYQNLSAAPRMPSSRLSRPLPSTPPTNPGLGSQSKRIRPLPPPPLSW